jgi:hypothetical protein
VNDAADAEYAEGEFLVIEVRQGGPQPGNELMLVQHQAHQPDMVGHDLRALLVLIRHALGAALERLVVALYEHMGLEEKLILPIAERHIFAAEWDKMVADGAAAIPPQVGPVLAGMLMYEGGLDVVPPEMREILADLAPRAYAAHCERVHGTPAPPRSTEVGLGTPRVGVGQR